MWEAWLEMAEESLEAAGLTLESTPRSSVSRYYYAAYQAVSALLLYQGLVAPEGREAWSHEGTPALLLDHTSRLIANRDERRFLSRKLVFLYRMRVSADYISADNVQSRIKDVKKDSGYVVKVCQGLMIGGRN